MKALSIARYEDAIEAYPRPVYSWDYLLAHLAEGLTGPPIKIHLVRHAQSVANARGLVTGQSDVGLSWLGYLQSFALGFRLPHNYDFACVSCLGRAHRTLQIAEIMRFRRVSRLSIHSDARLNERDLGDLEGTPRRRIEAYALGDLTYAPNHGESYLDLGQRLLSFLLDLRRELQHESRVIVATHVGPMRILVGIIEGLDNPRSVLALKFANAQAYTYILKDLTWPAFIQKEVLLERIRRQVGAAARTSHYSKV
jgi:2,3-bisphosphoglycerate-dependent phosphoglycerate mutase